MTPSTWAPITFGDVDLTPKPAILSAAATVRLAGRTRSPSYRVPGMGMVLSHPIQETMQLDTWYRVTQVTDPSSRTRTTRVYAQDGSLVSEAAEPTSRTSPGGFMYARQPDGGFGISGHL